jgi:DNA-directed RNA polymerase subunit E'/Rpb7
VVFRPFKGEVIAARIADQSPEGINRQFSASTLQSSLELTSLSTVVTDFFDDIFVPWTELPEGSELYATLSISSIIEQVSTDNPQRAVRKPLGLEGGGPSHVLRQQRDGPLQGHCRGVA